MSPTPRSSRGRVTGVDGQSRTSDDLPNRPLQVRYEQKIAKYGQIADQNRLQPVPAVFSHTGHIHGAREQIRQEMLLKARLSHLR